jgi:hypothetical protein
LKTGAALPGRAGPRGLTISGDGLRESLVGVAVASSFFVLFEPAPYDLLIILAAVVFVATGLRLPRTLLPFVLLVAIYQVGAVVTLTLVYDRANTQKWTIIGLYLAASGAFIAMMLTERTELRARLIANAWIFAGVCAGGLAILGYFRLVPFADSLLSYGRARATFKDPNVYAPFLVFPALVLMQRIFMGGLDQRKLLLTLAWLGVTAVGLLLSFSRGSWAHLVASAAIMTALTILSAPTRGKRVRIVVICAVGVLAAVGLLLVLLSLPSVGNLFAERASLEQNYDVEHGGRFSNHLIAMRIALERPFGIGIFQFAKIYGADVHNTYLNAFMSYGWIGGVALPALVAVTLVSGFRTVLIPAPWRPYFICALSTWTVLMMEAWIIDVDHWRHQWLLLGMVWGFIAASAAFERRRTGLEPRRGVA